MDTYEVKYDSFYEKVFDFLINAEGKYSNDPYDSGGETIYGIAKNKQPKAFEIAKAYYDEGDMIGLINYVKSFYYRNFWIRAKCHLFKNVKVSAFVFDTAVNMGIRRSIRMLQRGINFFLRKLKNKNEKDAPNILKVDGIWGKKSQIAYEYIKLRINMNEFFTYLISWRIKMYVKLSYYRNNFKFLRGWINRVSSLIQTTLSII